MKPIFTALAPNTEWDDVRLALKLMLQPWRWSRGEACAQLEGYFRSWLPIKHAYAFSSGRGALYALLQTLSLAPGDEVLLQAYTCVAVPDPILWAGAKPVYVNCEADTFNMSLTDLEQKITPQSLVLIIQHTFGLPADIDALLAIARKHKLFVIEDCAHALGATYHNRRVGTFGDAALYSFGRDKVISSVFGGLVVTSDDVIARQLKDLQATLLPAPPRWILQQLNHPIVTAKAKLFYRFGLGKLILTLAKALRLISKSVYHVEKHGGKPNFIEYRMPNALAELALHQLNKLERFNLHRKMIARLYSQKLANTALSSGLPKLDDDHIYLRYTIRSRSADKILAVARKRSIFLSDWYGTPIAPAGVDYAAIKYKLGLCPVAETIATESINLPTDIHIGEREVNRIVDFLKNFN